MPRRWMFTVAVVDATPLELTDPCLPAVATSTEITGKFPLDLSARRYARGPVAGKKIPPIVAAMPWLVEAPLTGLKHPQPVAGSTRPQPVAGSTRPQPVAGSTRPQPVATR